MTLIPGQNLTHSGAVLQRLGKSHTKYTASRSNRKPAASAHTQIWSETVARSIVLRSSTPIAGPWIIGFIDAL
ncbi:MAG: hypothetical protein ACYCY2_10050, partial [Acidithiobacillus ferriphilus]